MTDPMQTAVEVLARALPRVTMDASRVSAAALLAEIAPLIRAEEREACAKVADERSAAYAHHWPKLAEVIGEGNPAVKMMQACQEDAAHIAAAIRQRGNE